MEEPERRRTPPTHLRKRTYKYAIKAKMLKKLAPERRRAPVSNKSQKEKLSLTPLTPY